MPMTSARQYDTPINGTASDDFITIESSISFQWVPDPGNSYVGDSSGLDWDTWEWYDTQTTGPSQASGSVIFNGIASSEPFQGLPAALSFHFTNGNSFGFPSWQMSYPAYADAWTYDPATGILDPHNMYFSWDDWIGTSYSLHEANYATAHWSGNSSDTEYGHWQLVPDVHNVNVYGGTGNDTILGGQGREMLFGGDGNDLIRASVGDDLLYGGPGQDQLHAGIGRQTLMGGSGNDTIWGGTGPQLLLGDDGQDVVHAGSGQQTIMGGSDNDVLWGGSGLQLLEGGDGNDILHAASGNETLSGGAGRDAFMLATASGHDVITDFQQGQDIITISSHFYGLILKQAQDLLQEMSSDAQGNAVLDGGSDFGLVLRHITLRQVEAHPADFFRLSG